MMKLLHRRETPPEAVLAQIPKDQRIVSWAETSSGSHVLATPAGLWWPAGEGELRLIGWQFVNKAVWNGTALVLTEAELLDDLLLIDKPDVAVELVVPRDLPPTIRKRVESNVVRSEVLSVAGGQARFVARRIPGQDGVQWWARLEPGTRDTEDIRSAVSARLAMMRAEWDEEVGAALRR
jgi:hypothetical protein